MRYFCPIQFIFTIILTISQRPSTTAVDVLIIGVNFLKSHFELNGFIAKTLVENGHTVVSPFAVILKFFEKELNVNKIDFIRY